MLAGTEVSGNVRGSGAEYWGFTDTDAGPTVIGGNVEFVETFGVPNTVTNASHNFACDGTVFEGNFSVRNSTENARILFGASVFSEAAFVFPPIGALECDEPGEDGGNDVGQHYEAIENRAEVRQRYNDVGGNFWLQNNDGGAKDVIRNDVAGHIVCRDNDPQPDSRGNTESGPRDDQCPA